MFLFYPIVFDFQVLKGIKLCKQSEFVSKLVEAFSSITLQKFLKVYGLVASYHFSFKGEVTYLVFVILFVLLLIRHYMTFHVHL